MCTINSSTTSSVTESVTTTPVVIDQTTTTAEYWSTTASMESTRPDEPEETTSIDQETTPAYEPVYENLHLMVIAQHKEDTISPSEMRVEMTNDYNNEKNYQIIFDLDDRFEENRNRN